MGLQTKRVLVSLKEGGVLSSYEKDINEASGASVSLEINEESFSNFNEQYLHLLETGIKAIVLDPVLNAIKNICQDSLGKEAIKEVLNKVVIVYDRDTWTTSFELEEGVLTVKHDMVSNSSDSYKIEEVTKNLEDYITSKC